MQYVLVLFGLQTHTFLDDGMPVLRNVVMS